MALLTVRIGGSLGTSSDASGQRVIDLSRNLSPGLPFASGFKYISQATVPVDQFFRRKRRKSGEQGGGKRFLAATWATMISCCGKINYARLSGLGTPKMLYRACRVIQVPVGSVFDELWSYCRPPSARWIFLAGCVHPQLTSMPCASSLVNPSAPILCAPRVRVPALSC